MPLEGLRILDMTRVLAGPTCTQILGDLGADVIKLEKPGSGDDSRSLGPPYFQRGKVKRGASAYFLSVNRNKRSVALDLTRRPGQELVRRLIQTCDVVVENFRPGNLKRYGLDYPRIKKLNPKVVYCSITGFGQSGPYAGRGGYDFLAQAMGGIMSVTGFADTPPTKVGVGISDIVAGLYAAVAIMAAVRVAERDGRGQHIDMALLDCQIAWLSYVGQSYLLTERLPERLGNQHPNIAPYQVFMASDGPIALAVGNDEQFKRFCRFAKTELASDPRFARNDGRVKNRHDLTSFLNGIIVRRPVSYWVSGLVKANVPCCSINNLDQVFADPQVKARRLVRRMPYRPQRDGKSEELRILASPLNLPNSPVRYRLAPPHLGEHSRAILDELGLSATEMRKLAADGIVGVTRKEIEREQKTKGGYGRNLKKRVAKNKQKATKTTPGPKAKPKASAP